MKEFSEETRKKMSESAKKRCQNPEQVASQIARGTKLDEDKVRQMYKSGMTQSEIADELGVTQKVVWRFMLRHGIRARNSAKRDQWREKNSSWKGGERIERGYLQVYNPEHHKAAPNGYVRYHDIVAEEKLGRELKWYGLGDERSEVVHHINGNKLDNRPENLVVLSNKEHRRIHSAVTKEQVDDVFLERISRLEQEIKDLTAKLEKYELTAFDLEED